jgi:hypothetical protein
MMTLLDRIDELLDDDRYLWAFDTLSAIRISTAKHGETPGRVQAVENITRAISNQQKYAIVHEGLPSERLKTSRRYEGFEEKKR